MVERRDRAFRIWQQRLDDERDPLPSPVPENKAKAVHTQAEGRLAPPGVPPRSLVCHPQLPQRSHLLRRFPRQLQAHRPRHKAQRKEGPAVPPAQRCATPASVHSPLSPLLLGVVSAPLWNSEKSRFAGMLTVLDIIHLIQYYYHNLNYEAAAADVETFRLELLRGMSPPRSRLMDDVRYSRQTSRRASVWPPRRCSRIIPAALSTMPPKYSSKPTLAVFLFSITTPKPVTRSSCLF